MLQMVVHLKMRIVDDAVARRLRRAVDRKMLLMLLVDILEDRKWLLLDAVVVRERRREMQRREGGREMQRRKGGRKMHRR